MGFELSIDPPRCDISVAGGTKKYKLVNHCDRMLAYKVVINPDSNYSVPEHQLYGLIQIGYTGEIEITRKAGKPRADKMVIQYVSVGQDARDAKKPFNSGKISGEIAGETVMKLIAAE
ncbi:MSP domain protein [Oesophagostomum dentatum]|uniref:MSP domain protein n=1 Tax=Oesophagostomum dentatum TaxID=61180 RepID=A0A0B1T027_OESDE|nr:MSP domain protein [Oesophagostomum dentatum]